MITDKDIPGLRKLWQQAFGDSDALLDKFFSVGFSTDRCNCIREGAEIVAALYWFDCTWKGKKVAYIYAVATKKAHRGKGLCRRLMEDTHRQLKALGYCGAALVPAEKSLFEMYEKFGYRPFCTVETKTQAVSALPPATAISPAEYGALRVAFVGDNALLQDRAALDFLAGYGSFYKGENLLFCGYREGENFHLEEAFGLRAPPARKLQAMYLPLDGSEALPDYFAIPLN